MPHVHTPSPPPKMEIPAWRFTPPATDTRTPAPPVHPPQTQKKMASSSASAFLYLLSWRGKKRVREREEIRRGKPREGVWGGGGHRVSVRRTKTRTKTAYCLKGKNDGGICADSCLVNWCFRHSCPICGQSLKWIFLVFLLEHACLITKWKSCTPKQLVMTW